MTTTNPKLLPYENRGLTGLANLGNTCFLNSCMQVLNHTYELHPFFDAPQFHKLIKKDIPDSMILTEWNDLSRLMWSNNGAVSPNKFVHYVQQVAAKKGRELFTGWAQNDMPEFLLFIIECMHNSVSRGMKMNIRGTSQNNLDNLAIQCYSMLKTVYEKEYSEIMDLFYGIYVSQIVSKDNQTIHSIKPESYFMLDLPIPSGKNINLYDCLDYFTENEKMEGENAWFNEKTNQKEDVHKNIVFWSFPKVLVITLKRFTPDGKRRMMNLIDFPLEDLDLSKYVRGYNPKQYVYDLYGVCNHRGGTLGGHYTSYVKNANGLWYHFNDTSVSSVSKIVTPMAYCLFYRKKNNLL